MKKYNQWELNTNTDHMINTLVIEQADSIAEKITELECEKIGIDMYEDSNDGLSLTEEAQDIFNVYYDEWTENMYRFVNSQQAIIVNKPKASSNFNYIYVIITICSFLVGSVLGVLI